MPGIFGVLDASPFRADRDHQGLVEIGRKMSVAMMCDAHYTRVLFSLPSLGACVGRVGLFTAPELADARETDTVVLTTSEGVSELTGSESRTDRRSAYGLRRDDPLSEENNLLDVLSGSAAFLGDSRRARWMLLNDRYGRERIFLHHAGSRMFFSSEAKAILAVVPETRDFDPIGLAELLACGCTIGSHSLFRGIEILEAGTVVTLEGASFKRRRYFEPSRLERLEPTPAREFLQDFPKILRSAVNSLAVATPKVGISLTGGIDSRMIMASLDASSGSVPCYTFGSMYRTTGDVAISKQVAACCGQPHEVLELGRDFLVEIDDNLSRAVYVSDGYLGLSGAAELYVNRLVRSLAPARMTGNWGGELMRGVRAFKYITPKGAFLSPELSKQVHGSAATFATTFAHPLSATLFQQMPLQGYGRYAIERSQVVLRTPFLEDSVVESLYRAPAQVRQSLAAMSVLERRPDLLLIPTDAGLLGKQTFVRRALRRALIKAEYWTSHGTPNWLARLAASVPPSVIETRFLGVDKFQHFRFWIRHQLAEFVRETLIHSNNSSLQSWFETSQVARMTEDHIAGRANYTDEIDKLLTVAVTDRVLFKRFSTTGDGTPASAGRHLELQLG